MSPVEPMRNLVAKSVHARELQENSPVYHQYSQDRFFFGDLTFPSFS